MAKKPTYIAISSEQLEGAINSYKNLNRSKGLEKYKNRFVGVPGVSLTIKNIIPRYFIFFGEMDSPKGADTSPDDIKKHFFTQIRNQGFRFREEGFFTDIGAFEFPGSIVDAEDLADAYGFGRKHATIEAYDFTDKTNRKLLYQIFVSAPTLLVRNQMVATDFTAADSAGMAFEQQQRERAKRAQKKGSLGPVIPGDISVQDDNKVISIYTISNIDNYAYVTSFLLKKVKQRIDHHSIVLNKQIDFIYQSTKIRKLPQAIKSIKANNVPDAKAADLTKIKFMFDREDYTLRGILFLNQNNRKGFLVQTNELSGNLKKFFNDKTTNSIIYNLSKIYNKYSNRITVVSNNLFEGESDLKTFIQRYIYPKSTFRDSGTGITNDLIETFILGDIRMLDDDVFREYVETNAAFASDAFKGQMEAQVSQQYEGINDIIGEAFFKGKFREIESTEDFFEDLLNYVPIPELIALSTRCLLKLIPLREWIDKICKDFILKHFDEHKETIIQELESMDNGVAKDLSTRLKDIYFNRILNEDLIIDTARGAAETLVELTSNAFVTDAWRAGRVTDMKLLFSRLSLRYAQTTRALGLDSQEYINDKIRKDLQDNADVNWLWSDSLIKRKQQKEFRRQELNDSLNGLREKKSVFGGVNEPTNVVSTEEYYVRKISEIDTELVEINNGITNARDLLLLFRQLFETVFPALLELNPYLTTEEKNELKAHYRNDLYFIIPNGYNKSKALKALNNIESTNLNFEFPVNYDSLTLSQKQTVYDQKIVKLIDFYDLIGELENSPNNSLKILNQLQKQGTEGLDLAVNEIFGNDTERYYLCLAIIGAIPAAIYMIVKLFQNLDETIDDIKKATGSVVDAVEKRILLFMRYDYPYLDILAEFGKQLGQIAINLTRDLIVTGLMMGMEELRKLCSDEEQVNAPYNPVGSIDLSNFLINSKRGTNGQKTGTIEASPSYTKISTLDPSITPQIYESILLTLSLNFSINELFSLFGDTASDELYTKVLEYVLELSPDLISPDSGFFNYYLNESGMRQFIEILSKDIEFSFFAKAKAEYERQKELLLQACITDDYSFIVENFDFPEGQNINDFLAANVAKNRNAIDIIRRNVENMMQGNTVPTLCEDGKGFLTDPQKFTAKQIAQSIFDTIDENNSQAVSIAKDLYTDPGAGFEKFRSISPSLGQEPVSTLDLIDKNRTELINFVNKNDFAGRKIFESLFNSDSSITDPLSIDNFKFIKEENQEVNMIRFFFEESDISNEKIDFKFDINKDELDFRYGLTPKVSEGEEEIMTEKIVSYSQNKYFESIKQQFEIENIPDSENLTPSNNFFGYPFGIITQPSYNQAIKYILSDFVLNYENQEGEDAYLIILNSIFKDLFLFSFKTGLYQKDRFNLLNLNKQIVNSFSEDTGQDNCFLGFFHPQSLTEETVKFAERIVCYYSNSATQTPVNIAFVKSTFDCFIRTIVLQEFMQSFFNFGIFPQELIFSEASPHTTSFYEKIVRIKIEDALKNSINSLSMDYASFYNDIFKKFIVDITRIIFQNQNLSEENALTFVINSQIQFVKNMFKKAYINAFGLSESVIGETEFQLLEQKIFNDLSNDSDVEQSAQNVALLNTIQENFDISEKIRSIQNDGLTAYYDATKNVPTQVLFNGDTYFFKKIEDEETGVTNMVTVEVEENIPVFLKNAEEPGVGYLNFEDFTEQVSTDPNKITHQNVKGLILDKYIELKPNTNFLNEETFLIEGGYKMLFDQFIELLEKYIEPYIVNVSGVEISGSNKGLKYRTKLKMLLYETKLFVLFPQITNFIDSLDEKYLNNIQPYEQHLQPLWVKYYNIRGGKFDLFSKTYAMNFDPDFFKDEENVDWFNSLNTTPLLKENFNFSLFGKIRLGDFENILSKFLYPSPFYSLKLDQSLDQNQINKEVKSQISNNLINGFGKVDYLKTLFTYKTRVSEFYDLIKGVGQDDFELLRVFMEEFVVDEVHDGKNLFHWFYEKKVSDIFHVNTCIRLEMKLPDSGNLQISSNFANKSLTALDKTPNKRQFLQKILLEEKFGPEIINNENNLFSAPIFELKEQIPDYLTWFDFFVNVDKESYFLDDNFYNVKLTNDLKNVNSILFPTQVLRSDCISFYNRLKTFSSTTQGLKATVRKDSYYSTYWWNIQGKAYTLQEITKAIYGIEENENQKNKILDALTPDSLESFGFSASDVQTGEAVLESAPKFYIRELNSTDFRYLFANILKGADAASSPLVQFFDKKKMTFESINGESIDPYIAINPAFDWGWFFLLSQGAEDSRASELNKAFVGAEFESGYFFGYGGERRPIGPTIAPKLFTLDEEGNEIPFDEAPDLGYVVEAIILQGRTNYKIITGSPKYEEYGLYTGVLTKAQMRNKDRKTVTNWLTKFVESGGTATITYGAIKGGISGGVSQIIEKDVFDGNPSVNIYDLFSAMLKDEKDKQMFDRILKSLFIKEQTTIIAIIHRILSNAHYPEVKEAFIPAIADSFETVLAAVASANGDYQHTSESNSGGSGLGPDAFARGIASVGLGLVKFFFGSLASSVDPTWRTPWFAPGPLTPFGIAAKLLEEQKIEEPPEKLDKAPTDIPAGVCEDSLLEAGEFFTEFLETYKDSLASKEQD